MKSIIFGALLLSSAVATAVDCQVEDVTADQGRSNVKVTGITNCPEPTQIHINFRCDGEYFGSEWTFIRPGGSFRVWPKGVCNGEFTMTYVVK